MFPRFIPPLLSVMFSVVFSFLRPGAAGHLQYQRGNLMTTIIVVHFVRGLTILIMTVDVSSCPVIFMLTIRGSHHSSSSQCQVQAIRRNQRSFFHSRSQFCKPVQGILGRDLRSILRIPRRDPLMKRGFVGSHRRTHRRYVFVRELLMFLRGHVVRRRDTTVDTAST